MTRKKLRITGVKTRGPDHVRASISFPSGLYQMLADMAKQKKVSIAWVVRDAAEKYVADQRPLMKAE